MLLTALGNLLTYAQEVVNPEPILKEYQDHILDAFGNFIYDFSSNEVSGFWKLDRNNGIPKARIYNSLLEQVEEFEFPLSEYSIRYYMDVDSQKKNISYLGYLEGSIIPDPDTNPDLIPIISQNLFSSGDKYEYIAPVFSPDPVQTNFDPYTVWYRHPIIGFEIRSTDGVTYQKIEFGGDFTSDFGFFHICGFRDHKYVIFEVKNSEGEKCFLFYLINKHHPTDKVKRVGEPVHLTATPSIVRHNENVTIKVENYDSGDIISIIDMAGKTVYRGKIPQGQDQIIVPAAKLSKGLNIVTSDHRTNSSKILVK